MTKPGNRSRAFMSGAQLLSNAFTVGLSNAGEFNTYGERTIDVVIDVSCYFAP